MRQLLGFHANPPKRGTVSRREAADTLSLGDLPNCIVAYNALTEDTIFADAHES
jgi:hypothetical protein